MQAGEKGGYGSRSWKQGNHLIIKYILQTLCDCNESLSNVHQISIFAYLNPEQLFYALPNFWSIV